MCPCVPSYPDHITPPCFSSTPSDKHCHGETEAGDLADGWGSDFTENKLKGDPRRGSVSSEGRAGTGGLCACLERWGCLRWLPTASDTPDPAGENRQRVVLPPAKDARDAPGCPAPSTPSTQPCHSHAGLPLS